MEKIYFFVFIFFLAACRDNSRQGVALPYEQAGIKLEKRGMAFGEVYYGQVGTDTIHIQNVSGKPWEGDFNYDIRFIKVEAVPYRLEPGEKGMIVGELDTRLYGKYDEYIGQFHCYNRIGAEGNLFFTVTAMVKEDFSSLTNEERRDAPAVYIVDSLYNFGKIKAGEPVVWKFHIKNTGKKDLIIRNITTSCGCTVAKLESRVIRPGQSGPMEVAFRTSGRSGRQHKTITLTTNDYRRPHYSLVMEGEVIPNKEIINKP